MTSPAVLACDIAEDVRMAADDLAGHGALHVGQVEDAGLRRVLGVQHDLQEQVAELVGQVRGGAALEGVVDLVGLLQQERPKGQVVLLAVPGAAVRLAQAIDEPGEREGAANVALVGQWRQQGRPGGQRGRICHPDRPVARDDPGRGDPLGRAAAAERPGRRRGHGVRAGRQPGSTRPAADRAARGGQARAGEPPRGRRVGRPGGRGPRSAGHRPGRRQPWPAGRGRPGRPAGSGGRARGGSAGPGG